MNPTTEQSLYVQAAVVYNEGRLLQTMASNNHDSSVHWKALMDALVYRRIDLNLLGGCMEPIFSNGL